MSPPDTDAERDVVVGLGVGGLAGAPTAAVEGDCTVTSWRRRRYSVGRVASPVPSCGCRPHHMQARGIDDSVEQAVAYLGDLAGPLYANPEAARWLAEHASEAIG
jgi:hypothetical protein